MTTNVHDVPSSLPRLAGAWTESYAHVPGPPVRVLGRVTLALVFAVPVLLALMVFFGVLVMRANGSSPHAGN
jgi:hypothetical protein